MKRLIIKGACQNNLKGIDLEIDTQTICGVSGPSGAGKSSLVFDTIYSEAQRRFIETFSPYARQFLERLPRPKAKALENLPAAIAVGQWNPVRNSRSTVATLSDISFAARMLFFRNAEPFCTRCGVPVRPAHHMDVMEFLKSLSQSRVDRAYICVKVKPDSVDDLTHEGFGRILLDGRLIDSSELRHEDFIGGDGEIHVVIDRLSLRNLSPQRVQEAVETGFALGDGHLFVIAAKGESVKEKRCFTQRPICPVCSKEKSASTMLLFSFNSPEGACRECKGFGRVMDIDWDLVIPDPSKSLVQGAIRPLENWQDEREFLFSCCESWGIDITTPWRLLSREQKDAVLFGRDEWYGIKGIFDWLETKRYKSHIRILLSRYRAYNKCPICKGARFNEEALSYRLANINIAKFYAMSVEDALVWCKGLKNELTLDKASSSLVEELIKRLSLIIKAGLGYLSLDRQSRTLSGGELSRLCLAKGVSVGLSQTLYCIDEPSSGLHPKDMQGVMDVIKGLKTSGNTVLLTENDPLMLQCADRVICLGPGSGREGGQIVFDGGPEGLQPHEAFYLKGEARAEARSFSSEKAAFLELSGVRQNNLKGFSCKVPLGHVTCVCGVSGSGKSTLVEGCLYRGLLRKKGIPCSPPGDFDSLILEQEVDEVVFIDQEPVSKTPRACAGTYLKILDPIRRLLANTDEAKALGLRPGYFSLNVDGGRCEECQGQGFEMLDMQFLPDVMVPCPVCKGRRFSSKATEIEFKGKSICDFLEMTLDDIYAFFKDEKSVKKRLEPALGLGLGHLLLGQPLNTLSAGDCQRLKIARYLGKARGKTIFILDEPTKGLHPGEVSTLIEQIHTLSTLGNTVVVVEHDLPTILSSHWIIELGPEGGAKGGHLLYQGCPQGLLELDTPTSLSARQLQGQQADYRYERGEGTGSIVSEKESASEDVIEIRGARHHNLKDISLTIPRNKLVVVTGVSGSGKSSLSFDIIHKEAQRRYLESLPSYMKQFMRLHQRCDVDVLKGLTPSVAIEQKASRGSSMSTVATLSETAHYLRLLYAHCSRPICLNCGNAMTQTDRQKIWQTLNSFMKKDEIIIGAPRIRHRKGYHQAEIDKGFRLGADFVMVDGKILEKGQKVAISRYGEHSVSWLWGPFGRDFDDDALKKAFNMGIEAGKGTIFCLSKDGTKKWLSLNYFCRECLESVDTPDPLLFSFHTKVGRCKECLGKGKDHHGEVCAHCNGTRLNKVALSWQIGGLDIASLMSLEVREIMEIMKKWNNEPSLISLERQGLFSYLAGEILSRLELMSDLGLGYLCLDRSGDTLSGGEAQRINLCAQTASGLTGITVVLDEPTIGLHPVDTRRLIVTLKKLRDRGNNVIVVEHDEETILNADHVIDLGPGGGKDGGNVVFSGAVKELLKDKNSKTAKGLTSQRPKVQRSNRLKRSPGFIRLKGVVKNNLKSIDADIPIGAVTVITGVSGSGKTSLQEALLESLNGEECDIAHFEAKEMPKGFLHIDHSPIGRSPRSCPATFLGIFSHIRRLFSRTPAARVKGFEPSSFSFNTKEGACPDCKGQGQIKQSLGLLPDVYVTCQSCMGKRFKEEVLGIRWKSKDISQVLDMTVAEALEFFRAIPQIRKGLDVMSRLGLGYLTLGQPSPTLSGGEAQRLKIAKELSRGGGVGGRLYILDEPSVGLHMEDVDRLSECLSMLAEAGNTVFVVEHNLSMIAKADWIIELGPGGGKFGGNILFQGPLYDFISSNTKSVTLECLKEYLFDTLPTNV